MATSAMPMVKVNGISSLQPLHANGEIALRRFQGNVVVLCEALHYVELSVFIIVPPVIP